MLPAPPSTWPPLRSPATRATRAGFWLRPDWLWDDPLPEVEAALLQVAGDEYARHLVHQLSAAGYLGDEGAAD